VCRVPFRQSSLTNAAAANRSSRLFFEEIDKPLRESFAKALLCLAFPYNENTPSLPTQLRPVLSVAPLIVNELRLPMVDARFRHSSSSLAVVPMPKAAVNRNDLPESRKH